jgi:hypothetical protein
LPKLRTRKKNRSCLGDCTSGRGEDIMKRCRRLTCWKYSVHICVNGKMRPVETIPGMGGRGDKGE